MDKAEVGEDDRDIGVGEDRWDSEAGVAGVGVGEDDWDAGVGEG